MSSALAHPLSWPTGWKRTAPGERVRARFGGGWSVGKACEELLAQLSRAPIHARRQDVIISTNVELRLDGLPRSNQRMPEDPGAAVYFQLARRATVLACDAWLTVEHNLRALAAHVEALRALDRHGVGTIEQAFLGYAALPERAGGRTWWEVLELDSPLDAARAGAELTVADVRDAYRMLSKERHPDFAKDGGVAFRELTEAMRQGLEALGGA